MRLEIATLHGNPLAAEARYRTRVLALLPWLKQLDYSGVTVLERQESSAYRRRQQQQQQQRQSGKTVDGQPPQATAMSIAGRNQTTTRLRARRQRLLH
eukprot:COSAG01_NODE_30104_length_622_cov_51.590822_1_plen_98_part_00